MIITLDCRMIDASGVGVYLRGILPFLLQSNHNFLLLGNTARLQSYTSSSNVSIVECSVKPFSIKELLFFPSEITKQINKTGAYYTFFFNVPCGIKVPVYTTIHDMIFPDMPELFSKIGLAARMWFFRRAYKKSQKIFTVSEFSKSRIHYHLGAKKPVIVTYCAIQQMFLEYRNSARNIQKRETIVFIGNIKKHKGLDCLVDAFHQAKKEGLPHKLMIIGSKENFRTSDNAFMQKMESMEETITFTGFISDEKLMEYLSTAALLVQPSLYEGFCFPPLEAMVLGTHALISDIPVLKEVYAEYPATFFRAGDSGDLKEKMMALLLDKNTSSPVLSEPLLTKYTFEKTSSIIMKELL